MEQTVLKEVATNTGAIKTIIGSGIASLTFLAGWVKMLSKSISDHKQEIAKEYATKEEVGTVKDDLKTAIKDSKEDIIREVGIHFENIKELIKIKEK